MTQENNLTTVGRYIDAIQAHLVCGRLESEGIKATIVDEHHVWANWLISNAIGGVKVQVSVSEADDARRILAAFDRGEYSLEVAEEDQVLCPICGSTDVKEVKASWRIAFLSLFFLNIPLPFGRGKYMCRACRRSWKPDPKGG